MHGVPRDLNLSIFVGANLQRIDLGKWIIHFQFDSKPPGTIGVEGNWELIGSAGRVIDRQMEPAQRECYRVHHLLLQDVVSRELHAPEWFALTFENGMVLKIYDDSQQYESFSIQPGDIFV